MRFLSLLSIVLAATVAASGCADKDDATHIGLDGQKAPGTLEGVVVDDAIRPLSGVRVDLDDAMNATTGQDGAFRFDGVTPGAHIVRATKNGFADAVSQVIVAASEPTPLVKLVLIVDTSNLAYAETLAIDGFVECGTYSGSYFAACGGPNVGSFILCAQTDVCLGNLTGDRYIVIHQFDRTPTFLATETAWTSTQALGNVLSVWLGSATVEQLRFYPETPSVWNRTEGPSPLYGTMNATMLADSGIGIDAYFLAQVFAGDEETVPIEVGLTVQQRFTMYLTSFYGYQPPSDWRFSTDGTAPPPMA